MVINCLIIEDEPASMAILEKYVRASPSLNLVGVFEDALSATETLSKEKIDLLFLDINMPKLSGMQFYKSLVNPPLVIFTTAYPQYAVEGFEVNAVDYLLKPYPLERFLKAVHKAISLLAESNTAPLTNEYVVFTVNKKIHRVLVKEIHHLEAMGDYVKVFFAQDKLLVHDTLQNILAQLPRGAFLRVHRSHAIALNQLKLIEGNRIELKDKKIPIGQKYRQALMQIIKGKS